MSDPCLLKVPYRKVLRPLALLLTFVDPDRLSVHLSAIKLARRMRCAMDAP